MKSYSSPKVVMRPSSLHGKGLFAGDKIFAGELVVDFSSGRGEFINCNKADTLYEQGNDHMIQVDDDLFFAAVSTDDIEDEDHINHSCEPNCGIRGSLQIVAMRDVEPGEEMTLDYAMFESSQYSFKCICGARNCRRTITGDDWRILELQKRYAGYFSGYLQKKIEIHR